MTGEAPYYLSREEEARQERARKQGPYAGATEATPYPGILPEDPVESALQGFLYQPEPATPDETKVMLDQMVELVRRAVQQRDLEFGLQLQTSAAAADAAQEMTLLQGQQHQALAQAYNQMMTTDARVPGVEQETFSKLSRLSTLGIPPTQVGKLLRQFRTTTDTQKAVDEDVRLLEDRLQEWAKSGRIEELLRGAEGGARGLISSGTAGLVEPRSFAESLTHDVQGLLSKVMAERFPPESDLPGEWADFSGRRAGPAVDRDTYEDVVRTRYGRALEQVLEQGWTQSQGLERMAEQAGHVVGIAFPMSWAMRAGAGATRAATGLARLTGLLAKTGVEGKVAQGIGKTIMELGQASTGIGAFLQRTSGQGLALFGLGAAAVPRAEEERIAREVAPEDQDEARLAARVTGGLQMMATAPLFVMAGRLGRLPKSWSGGTAATATAFSLMGEGLEVAEHGVRKGLAELSPEFREKLERRIIADPELHAPIVRMLQSDGPGSPEFDEALTEFMEGWAGNFAGFGALHALSFFGRRVKGEYAKQFDALVKELQFDQRKAIDEMAVAEPVKVALRQALDQAAAKVGPSYEEREARRVRGELEREFGSIGAQQEIGARVRTSLIEEGQAPGPTERLAEVRDLRREADAAVEEGVQAMVPVEETEARAARAERLGAAEEYLRAVSEGREEGQAELYGRYRGQPITAEGFDLVLGGEAEGPRGREIARQMLEERAQEREAAQGVPGVAAEHPEHWSNQPGWETLPRRVVEGLERDRWDLALTDAEIARQPDAPETTAIRETQVAAVRAKMADWYGEAQADAMTRKFLAEAKPRPEEIGAMARGDPAIEAWDPLVRARALEAAAKLPPTAESAGGPQESAAGSAPVRHEVFGAVEKAMAGAPDATAALETIGEPLRRQVQGLIDEGAAKHLAPDELAAEALYRHLWTVAHGDRPPPASIRNTLAQLEGEFTAVAATRDPITFLAWQKLNFPDLQGPAGQVFRQWQPGKDLLDRIERHIQEKILLPANEGEAGMMLVPLSPPTAALRLLWWGFGAQKDLLRRVDAFTEQSGKSILDPSMLSGSNALADALGFVDKKWYWHRVQPGKFMLTMLTEAIKPIAQPLGFGGALVSDLSRTYALSDKTQHILLADLKQFTKDLPRSPTTAARDAVQYDRHLVTEMLRHPDHPAWGRERKPDEDPPPADQQAAVDARTPEQLEILRRRARRLREVLDELKKAAAEASPRWWAYEQERRDAERIVADAEGQVADLNRDLQERMRAVQEEEPSMFAEWANVEKVARGERRARTKAAEEAGGLKGLRTSLQEAKKAESRAKRAAKKAPDDQTLQEHLRIAEEQRAEAEAALESAKKPTAKEREATEVAREYRRSMEKRFDALGDLPYAQVRSRLRNQRRRLSRAGERLADITESQRAYVEAWGHVNYVRDILRADLAQGFYPQVGAVTERFGFHDSVVRKVRSSIMYRKHGKLYAEGTEDADFGRWMDNYIRQVVPYVQHQAFLRRWEEKLEGEWTRPDYRDLYRGVDTSWGSGAHNPWYDAKVLYGGDRYQAVLGHRWQVTAVKDGKKVRWYARDKLTDKDIAAQGLSKVRQSPKILLWRGNPPQKGGAPRIRIHLPGDRELGDPESVARGSMQRNLVPVPRRLAQDMISVQGAPGHEGFFRLASPRRVATIKEYLNDVLGAHSELGSLIDMGPATKWADKTLGTIGYWVNTLALAGFDPAPAFRGFWGAALMNAWIMGPERAASGLRYTGEYMRRLRRAKLRGHPDENLEQLLGLETTTGPEAVQKIVTDRAKRLRDGKDEMMDDLMESMYSSGILTGTRGVTWFERHPEAARKHPITRGIGWAVDKSWIGWEGLETVVRTSMYGEVYMAARRGGRSKEQAEELAFQAVNQAHGIFNPALRSRLFRTGVGRFLGPARSWWAHWTGVLMRLPPQQKSSILAYSMAAGALGAAISPDHGGPLDLGGLFGLYLHDMVPPFGEAISYEMYEAMPWLADVWPAGLPIFPLNLDVDTITVDFMRELGRAAEAGAQGDLAGFKDHLFRGFSRLGRVAVVEDVRKWFLAEHDPAAGVWMHKPFFGFGEPRTLHEHGLAYVIADTVLPRDMMQRNTEYFERRMRKQAELRQLGRQKAARSDLVHALRGLPADKLAEMMDFLESGTSEDRALQADAVMRTYPEIGEVAESYREAGLGDLGATEILERANQALGEARGIRGILAEMRGTGRKDARLLKIAKWLEGRSRITEGQWETFKETVAPARSTWAEWVYFDDAMPPELRKRVQDAAKKRGFKP